MRLLFVPYLFIDASVFSYNEVMTEDSLQQSTYRLLKLKHMSCAADCRRIICCACQTCLIGKKRGYDVGWEVSSYSYRVSRITPDAYGMTVPPWVGTAEGECWWQSAGARGCRAQHRELGHPARWWSYCRGQNDTFFSWQNILLLNVIHTKGIMRRKTC